MDEENQGVQKVYQYNYGKIFWDILSRISSIATITGISLLVMKDKMNLDNIIDIIITLFQVAFFITIITLFFTIIFYFHQKYFKGKNPLYVFCYWSLTILFAGILILALTGIAWDILLYILRNFIFG